MEKMKVTAFGLFMGWCCSWARFAEGICGILTFGFFTPSWGLVVSRFFAHKVGVTESEFKDVINTLEF